jgi:hypothetical protein
MPSAVSRRGVRQSLRATKAGPLAKKARAVKAIVKAMVGAAGLERGPPAPIANARFLTARRRGAQDSE